MAAGDVKRDYAASSDLTITLASLANDSTNLLAGQESTAVSNTTNKYIDYLLAGTITTGTSPTSGNSILVYVVGKLNDTTWPDVFDGTNSAETVTSANVRDSACKLAWTITVDSTSNRAYPFGPLSVAALFSDNIPKEFVVFVVNGSGVALNSTAGNHVVSITPVFYNVAQS